MFREIPVLEPHFSNLGISTQIPASFAARMWPSHQAPAIGFVLWDFFHCAGVGTSGELVATAPGVVSLRLLGGILQTEEAGGRAVKVWQDCICEPIRLVRGVVWGFDLEPEHPAQSNRQVSVCCFLEAYRSLIAALFLVVKTGSGE